MAATLTEKLQQQLKLGIIQAQITCPRSGDVLDIRTATFIYDADGDACAAISPAGLATVTEQERSIWRAAGLYLTATTTTQEV